MDLNNECASWRVPDFLPSRVIEILAMNPRLSVFKLRLIASGSTEASNYMKLLTSNSKITNLQIELEGEYLETTLPILAKASGVLSLACISIQSQGDS